MRFWCPQRQSLETPAGPDTFLRDPERWHQGGARGRQADAEPARLRLVACDDLRLRMKGHAVRAAIVPFEAIAQSLKRMAVRPYVIENVGPAWQEAVFRRA
jgi:hypothetical protein